MCTTGLARVPLFNDGNRTSEIRLGAYRGRAPSSALGKYNEFPLDRAFPGLVLMVVLRRKGIALIRRNFVATGLATIDARVRTGVARLVEVIELCMLAYL